MKKTKIKTKMRASDYQGNRCDTLDCPGHRAFKRACKQNMWWFNRLLMSYEWGRRISCDGEWDSINRHGEPVNMMVDTHIGEEITFIKYK